MYWRQLSTGRGRTIVANRYLEKTTDPSCSFWNLPSIWILSLLLLWLCAYHCLNKEREGVQFSELGMGTTALQDGSLPAPGAVLLARHSCSPVSLPARGWILSNARPSGQERRAPNGCRGIILVQMALRRQGEGPPRHSWWLEGCPWSPKQVLTLKMQGRLEEQLPSLRMASVGGCGKTTSGLPPITVSLHDSRSLHGSIRCLLDGVSKHSRTLWEDRAYLLLCLLETQLPAMWRFETGGCNLFCGYPR